MRAYLTWGLYGLWLVLFAGSLVYAATADTSREPEPGVVLLLYFLLWQAGALIVAIAAWLNGRFSGPLTSTNSVLASRMPIVMSGLFWLLVLIYAGLSPFIEVGGR